MLYYLWGNIIRERKSVKKKYKEGQNLKKNRRID